MLTPSHPLLPVRLTPRRAPRIGRATGPQGEPGERAPRAAGVGSEGTGTVLAAATPWCWHQDQPAPWRVLPRGVRHGAAPGGREHRGADGTSLLCFQGEKGDPGERVCSRRRRHGGSWLRGVPSPHPEHEPRSPTCCLCARAAAAFASPWWHCKSPNGLGQGVGVASDTIPCGTCKCTCAHTHARRERTRVHCMQACSAPVHTHVHSRAHTQHAHTPIPTTQHRL